MIRRLGTIRAITTAVATVVVAIALVIGAAGLIASLRRTMVDEEAETARAQATGLVRQLEAGRTPVLEVASEDEQLIQVLTTAGEVVASSPNITGRPVVAHLAPGQSVQLVTPPSARSAAALSAAVRAVFEAAADSRWRRTRRPPTARESFW